MLIQKILIQIREIDLYLKGHASIALYVVYRTGFFKKELKFNKANSKIAEHPDTRLQELKLFQVL